MEGFLIVFVLLGIGIFLVVKGIRLKMGYEKGRFFSPWVRLGNVAWMSLPSGVGMIMWGLAFLQSLIFGVSTITAALGLFLIISGLIMFFLGLLLASIQSDILKPQWLKWLESEHRDIIPLLRREARETGFDVWGKRVRTHTDLEEWVAEVRRKHGL